MNSPRSLSLHAGRQKRQQRTLTEKRPWLVLAITLVLALALRIYRIDAQSIWYDEGWSIHLARQPLRVALAGIASAGHTHPPAYYLLLMIWVRLFGSSVVAVRGLSALLGTLTIWAVYQLGLNLFDRPTGLASALLLAIAPAHITYSQETRMYVLLGLSYALLLTLSYRYASRARVGSWGDWVALVVVEILAVYTHYFAFLALLGLAIWVVVALAAEGRRGNTRLLLRWLCSQGVVLIAFCPWLGVALQRAATHVPIGALPPKPLPFVVETWAFLVGGHTALYSREPSYAAIAQACMGATALLTGWLLLGRSGKRRPVLFLAVQWLSPLTLMFLLMRARPGFHPRYLLMLLVPLVVLVGRIAVALLRRGAVGKLAGALFMLSWFCAMGLAGKALLTDGYYSRNDARGTAAFLQQRLAPDDLILADTDDWALGYYLEGHGFTHSYLNVGRDPNQIVSTLAVALPGRSRAALVKWHQAESDKHGLLSYLLERKGALIETRKLPGYTVLLYTLDEEPPSLLSPQVNVSFGPLRLLGATVETDVPADEGVTVALTWRKETQVTHKHKATLRLVDQAGRRLSSSDRLMLDVGGAPVPDWPVGGDVTTYHTLTLPPGIAPLIYPLRVGVYHEGALQGLDVLDEAGAPAGKSYELAEIQLVRAGGRTDKVIDRPALGLRPLPDGTRVAEGLYLEAVGLGRERVETGETLSVLLEWHGLLAPLPDYRPILRLTREGRVVTESDAAPVYGDYPTSRWASDETVLDRRQLTIPADAQPGPAQLEVAVRGGATIPLGQVEIQGLSHRLTAPQRQIETAMPIGDFAELVGYDLSATEVAAGQDIPLTLYWLATSRSHRSYVVFVHMLNGEGRLVAQHDSVPANGKRPTTGWIKGEFIVDPHILRWLNPEYRGQVVVEVGFYDPASGERLLTPEGDSRLLLPSLVAVR